MRPNVSGEVESLFFLNVSRAIHPHDVFAGHEGFIVIKSRQDAVSYLLNDQLLIALALFPLPKNAVRMAFHVVYITFRTVVLLVGKSYGETGSYFLCVHSV